MYINVFTIKEIMFRIFLVLYLLEFAYVSGSHFRGGFITWRPASKDPPNDGSFPQVLFSYRVSWERDRYFCDQQTIDDMTTIRGEEYLRCDNGCTTLFDDFDFICTDFSVDDDWTTGVGSSSFTPNSNMFDAFYSSAAWAAFQNGGLGAWILRTRVDLDPREDNGLINTAPVTATSPVVPLALNCPGTIQIAVTDADGDVVRCRYATGVSECASVCAPLLGATLDQDTCTFQWTPTVPGLYVVAVQIEDFLDSSSVTPLSSVPLQYILDVRSLGPCSNAPSFASDVLTGGSCVPVSLGQTFTTRITASVSNPSHSITSVNTISSSGLTTSPVQPVPGSATDYFFDVHFIPGPQSLDRELFCFSVMSNIGFPSEQRCITFATNVPVPIPLAASVDRNNIVTVTIDQMVRRADTSGSVRIVYAANQRLVYNFDVSSEFITFPDVSSHFKIQLPMPLLAGEKYLVQLDGGVVETVGGDCVARNDPADLPLMIEKPRTKKKFCF